jgi:hypothetical protein
MSDLEHPDDWLGLLSYRMADTGRFVQGPYTSLSKKHVAKMDVAARLVGDRIEFNAAQMKEMGVGDAVVQMMGLVFHQALMHMDRRRMVTGGLPQYQAAADLAAELAVWHKLEHPSQAVSNKFPKPGDFGFPEGESMEQYFKRIIDKAEQDGVDMDQFGTPTPQPGQGGGEGGESDEEQESSSQQLAKALGSKKDTHKQDHQGWGQVSSVQQEAMAANMPERLESWMKSRGIEPAGFKRLIDEIRNMKREKWYDKLRRLVGTKMAAREYRHTRKRPSRRHGSPHAGRVRLHKGMLAVAVDTSGSIAQTELTVFISKLAGIAKAYEAPFEVIVCDADISSIKRIAKKKDVEAIDLRGGGGTSSKPVFEYLEKHKVDVLVYLTDLFIDFPEEPPRYKVIWGVINRGQETNFEPAPFGETYHLDVDENPEAMAPRRKKK